MKLICVFIFVLRTQLLDAQILEQAAPESVNMSPERLQKVDTYIQFAIDKNIIPGGVFLLARKGKMVYHKSFGNSQENTAYKEGDIFRIASMTKAITTVAIMQLFENGLLGLDDPVEWFLPAYWSGYFNTKYFIDPEEELIFIGMTQVFGFQNGFFWDSLYTVMYRALND